MSGAGFDVFVVGTADPRPEARQGLAQSLAAQRGAPVAIVLRAIEARALRAGQGLDKATADMMANELRAMGAVVELRPISPTTGAGPAPFAGAPSSGIRIGGPPPPPAGAFMGSPTMADQPPTVAMPMEPAPTIVTPQFGAMGPGGDMATPSVVPQLPRSAAPAAGSRGRDPFAPRGDAGEMKIELAGAHPRGQDHRTTPVVANPGAAAGRDAFAAPDAAEPRLELAGPNPRAGAQASGSSAPGASALNTDKLSAGSSSSKMAIEKDGANANLTRCTIHGLYFDKKKASGCMKCLAGARTAAKAMEHRMTGFKITDFKSSPAKRAFIGLGLALLLGLVPAAIVAIRVGGAEITALRDEQDTLSHKVGTDSTLARFDEIDALVESAHSKSKRNTFIVWLLVTGGAMIGWYRVTEG